MKKILFSLLFLSCSRGEIKQVSLAEKELEIKDKPYWDSLDRKAIQDVGGLYFGDLPSNYQRTFMVNDTLFIFHPSTKTVEKRFLGKNSLQNLKK